MKILDKFNFSNSEPKSKISEAVLQFPYRGL